MSTAWIDDDGGLSSISYVGTAESGSSSITIPVAAQEGDIAVLYEYASGGAGSLPSLVTPSGWVNRTNDVIGTQRAAVFTKALVGGDPGASIAGTSGSDDNKKMMVVFRPNGPITLATYSTFTSEFTNLNPSAQVISAAGQSAPLIVLGGCGVIGSPVFGTLSPAFDAQIVPSHDRLRIGYKLYDSSPADHSIDMNDLGSSNSLWGGYITLQ